MNLGHDRLWGFQGPGTCWREAATDPIFKIVIFGSESKLFVSRFHFLKISPWNRFFKKKTASNSCVQKSQKNQKSNFLPAYQPGLPNNELIYKCPVRGCGKAFSKLGGIFKHLVPAHGYQVIFSRIVKKNCQ